MAGVAGSSKTLVYSWRGNVGPLNPHLYSPNQMFGQAMVYEPLVRYDGGGKIVPCLATSWEMEPDGHAWLFHLRKGVAFSDGAPFNAVAVKKNLDAVLANGERHAWLELTPLIREVQALDEYTVRIVLSQPYTPILEDLSLIRPFRFISPSAFPDSGSTADGITAPIGTGPWKLVKTRLGEYDIFERNEDYWGEKPDIDRIEVRVISDTNTCAMGFESGQVDLIYGEDQISLDTFARFRDDPRYITKISDPLASRVLAMNSNRSATRELGVRRAVQHALNKDAIISGIFLGTAQKVDVLLPENLPYCDLGLSPYGYDPVLAETLLEEAGWKRVDGESFRQKNGQILSLDICFVGNSIIEKSIAEVMQSDLKKVGIRLNLKGVEADLFSKYRRTGEFDLIFNDTWGAPYEPHAFCGSMRVPSHADFQAQAGLPMKARIDEAISRALTTLDETARREAYRYVLTTLHEQAVYLPICSINGLLVHRKELSGVGFGATQYEIPFEKMTKN
jgi:nickel transport system substrate-binding protein